MAESIAKREARRRRILENSESRLNKISGRTVINESTDSTWKNNSILEPGSPLSDFINSPSNISDSLGQSDTELDTENNDIEYFETFQQNQKRQIENNIYDKIYSEHSFEAESQAFNIPEYKESSFHYYLLRSRLCYVVLAAILNILLLNDMEYIYGQAIAIPYFTLMLCRSYASGRYQSTTDGSLVFATLILCNIKPQLIHKLKVMVNLFDMFLKDFALYMFSFILIHYGISFVYKFNIITPT